MFERASPTSTKELQALASSLIADIACKDELLAKRDQQIEQHEQPIAQNLQSIEESDRALATSLQELREANALAAKQRFYLARYRRWRFGKKSEALGAGRIALWEADLDAHIEAIEQRLENLQAGVCTFDWRNRRHRRQRNRRLSRMLVAPTHRSHHLRMTRDRFAALRARLRAAFPSILGPVSYNNRYCDNHRPSGQVSWLRCRLQAATVEPR